ITCSPLMSKLPGEDTNSRASAVNSAPGELKSIWKLSRSTSTSTSSRSDGTDMNTILLRTPIPGPKSQELMRRRNAAIARGVSHATQIFAARAEGAVEGDCGRKHVLAFFRGIWY